MTTVQKQIHPRAFIKVGKVVDESLTGRVRVSVIVAGMDVPFWQKMKKFVKDWW